MANKTVGRDTSHVQHWRSVVEQRERLTATRYEDGLDEKHNHGIWDVVQLVAWFALSYMKQQKDQEYALFQTNEGVAPVKLRDPFIWGRSAMKRPIEAAWINARANNSMGGRLRIRYTVHILGELLVQAQRRGNNAYL